MSCIRRPCMVFMAGPSRLEPDTGQEFAESGAISVFVTAAGRVLGCEHRAGDGEAPHPDSRQIRCREMAPHECALALSGTGFTFIADGEPDKAQG